MVTCRLQILTQLTGHRGTPLLAARSLHGGSAPHQPSLDGTGTPTTPRVAPASHVR